MATGMLPEVNFANDVASLIAQISPGVVSIVPRSDPRRRTVGDAERATHGAGLVWSRPPGGGTFIVSNAHVVHALRGAPVAIVSASDITSSATVCAVDRVRDLALLHIAEVSPHFTPLPSDGSPVAVGQFVLAIGHPLGVRHAVTSGVVHSVGPVQTLATMPTAQRGLDWLQIDVLLGPGNSGGPVVDAKGHVVGMNTMIASGLALAVPAAAIALFVHDYLRGVLVK